MRRSPGLLSEGSFIKAVPGEGFLKKGSELVPLRLLLVDCRFSVASRIPMMGLVFRAYGFGTRVVTDFLVFTKHGRDCQLNK